MERVGRKSKKSKFNKKVIFIIICCLIVGITFFMIYNIKTKMKQKEQNNNLSNANSFTDNKIDENDDVENNKTAENTTVENEVENNVNENTNINDNKVSKEDVIINENVEPAKPPITDKKEKAIDLVKKQWGKDESVDFIFDHIDENDNYVIAVKDRATATIKYYFKVDLKKETVELD